MSKISQNWNFYSVGLTIGSSNIIQGAGSAGIEYTSKPFYIYKANSDNNENSNKPNNDNNNIVKEK